MKTLGGIFLSLAVLCAIGGFFNTRFAGDMLTKSYETMLEESAAREIFCNFGE
jgi:hypothetical protein